eukprot:CAMPEP_0172173074 /NCGR_PEP_ID=MMETSP1050-20130122/12824_1 /TAXON_ID=233186 /ORGANISM="Cryptomonas curvata, Strain CCAP979/52" /LENGTH=397 /DNA_ID=CAMNT_0012844733 /DNA_START=789 /DNA_END=1979 /DNA_ORIENTATION=-
MRKRELLHRALGMMMFAILLYLFLWLFCGAFIMYGITLGYPHPAELVSRGFTKLWTASFLTASCFFNCGYTLTSDSLMEYVNAPGVYLWCCCLILAGNTAAPMCIRGIVRTMHHLAAPLRLDRDGLKFALDHPRLVTTHMFDHTQTMVLIGLLFVINGVQYAFFLSSDLNRPSMQVYGDQATLAGIGFFQTISTRNAGLQLVDLRRTNQGMLMVYIFTMYISAAPFISRMYVSEQYIDAKGKTRNTHEESKGAWGRFSSNYLFRHTAALYAAVLVCAFAEDVRLTMSESGVFYIIFEIISAYGNVGLSLGYPGMNYSLTGAMSSLSKFVIMTVMLLGKLRGLPTHTDIITDFDFREVKKSLRRAVSDASRDPSEAADSDSESDSDEEEEEIDVVQVH